MADIQQRVTSLEERTQAHETIVGELRKDIGDLRVELRTSVAALRTEISDLRGELHTSVAALRTEIGDLRGELRTSVAGLRTEISDLRVELRTEIAAIRGEMLHRSEGTAIRSEIADLRRDMNQRFLSMDQKFTWLVGLQVAGLIAVIGTLMGSYYR